MERWVTTRLLPAVVAAIGLAALVGAFSLLAGSPDTVDDAPPDVAPAPATDRLTDWGARFRVRVRPDGSVRVRVTLRLDEPVEMLDLSLPARLGAAGPTRPVVRTLALEADGRPVPVGQRPRLGRPASIALGEPARRVVVSYVATGVDVHSESAPRRSLTLVTPVVIAQASSLAWRVDVRAPEVLDVGCADPDGALTACGERTRRGWAVGIGETDEPVDVLVLGRLDLPVS